MPRRTKRVKSRQKRRKSTRPKRRSSARSKPKRAIRPVGSASTQSAELIWKETVAPQLAPDLRTIDQNLAMLEEAKKQAESLVAWADRHSKRFEAYVLTAISSLDAQIAYQQNILKVLLLRLGGIMVDIDMIAGRSGRAKPPELQESVLRLRDTIARIIETNQSSIEAAKKLMMYF